LWFLDPVGRSGLPALREDDPQGGGRSVDVEAMIRRRHCKQKQVI
jgi:hypothetical protein